MILVTGGAGFIGGNFVLDWLKDPQAEGIVNLDKLTYAGNLATLDSLKNDSRHILIHGDIGDHALVTRLLKRASTPSDCQFRC
jgi:dTDP-glucose 4,6-dehydratase